MGIRFNLMTIPLLLIGARAVAAGVDDPGLPAAQLDQHPPAEEMSEPVDEGLLYSDTLDHGLMDAVVYTESVISGPFGDGDTVECDGPRVDWAEEPGQGSWHHIVPFAWPDDFHVRVSFQDALCMESEAEGVNWDEWFSPYGEMGPQGGIDLVDRSVYECRFRFHTDQDVVGTVPLISLILDNSDPNDPFGAANAYSQQTFLLDNFGGNNSPISLGGFGRPEHEIWFAPLAAESPQWSDSSTGAFAPENDALNDMRMRFQIFDVDGGGWNAEADLGTVCMSYFEICRHNLDDMVVESTLYEIQNITPPTTEEPNDALTVRGFDSDIRYMSGDVTVLPTSPEGYTNEVVSFTPGDMINPIHVGGAETLDNYPFAQEEDALLAIEAVISQTPGTPLDLIRIGYDVPTQELISLTSQTPGMDGVGMPAVGAGQIFRAFVHGNSVTASSLLGHDHARPRLDFICHSALAFNAESSNTAGLVLESMTVKKVRFD